ncbi:MAG: transcriptional regulator [Gammaproteobacteria bacterium]|nr:transcriptional regulator [Gammaproteobacteria bacterium]
MPVSPTDLEQWLTKPEGEQLEFKEARSQFSSDVLTRYCVAIANAGGGRIILGVNDRGEVVGSAAFANLNRLRQDQSNRLHLNVEADEVFHANGRVVVVTVPARPLGLPIHYQGAYWMRRGEDLVAMPAEVLRRIFAEGQPDYSADTCPGTSVEDLSGDAVEVFRTMWRQTSGNDALTNTSVRQLLSDAELIDDRGGVTYAALILLGESRAVARHIAQAETIFEYRSQAATTPYEQRLEFKKGFLLYFDELWDTINLRNPIHQFTEGLLRVEVPGINETVAREAILNAIAHRDYRLGGSVFIRQFPRRLEITSPGGLPPGVTVDNLLWRQMPRNRRLAEAFAKCGLVERAGQGANRMFERCIAEGKALPDFTDCDDYQVSVKLDGEVRDENFLRFLEAATAETTSSFTTEHFLLLDLVHREQAIPDHLKTSLRLLIDAGVVESVGRGRGTRYLLSRRYYRFAGKPGAYTQRRGLDRHASQALLLSHIEAAGQRGCPMAELQEVLPGLSRNQIRGLLRALRDQDKVQVKGRTRSARWVAVS